MVAALVDVMNAAWEMIALMRNEFLIFVIAFLMHGLFFGRHSVGSAKSKSDQKIGAVPAKQPKAPEKPAKSLASDMVKSEVRSRDPHAPKPENEKYAMFRQQERDAQADLINSLKGLHRGVSWNEAERILVAGMNLSELDEALLTAIVDAAIRAGRADLLKPWARRQTVNFQRVKRAHTFSSVIRAYGAIHDLDGAWSTWSNMRKSHTTPTCVTLGCMVEALVANGDPESAYDLIQDIRTEAGEGKSVINAVIYGTVLKGFAHQKKFNRVWAVYQEMLAYETDFTIVTFNTIVDACSRCGELDHIPTLLEDMDRLMVRPNVITYGAILKGYCQEGNLDKAYELMKSMQETTDFEPDEIMFNTLLDGCANQGLWERANSILAEMQDAGIKPSNFTLSVLTKVGRRSSCHLDGIFKTCDEVALKYGIRFNVHVYTNLVFASCDRKNWARALATFAEMLRKRLRPDTRGYSVLLKGLVQAGEREAAAGVLRAALGIDGALPEFLEAVDGSASRLRIEPPLPKATVSEIIDSIVGGHSDELSTSLMQDLQGAGVAVDAKVKLRFAAGVAKGRHRN